MFRALLDTNVFISAAVRPSGPPGRIFELFLSHHAFELVVSPKIIAEIERAFGYARIRKYLRKPKDARLWLADLVVLADIVKDTGSVVGICRDPTDDMVLAAAVEGRANIIVTGDRDLLDLAEYEGVTILEPRVFLDALSRR